MFINSSAQQLTSLVDVLSRPRISNYRKFFGATSDESALGLYQWNEELTSSLFRALCLVEIVLRNQFHRELSNRYGHYGAPSSRNWYQNIALPQKSKDKIRSITDYKTGGSWIPKVPVPSPDDVVSKLTFGFWPHLLDSTVDSMGAPLPWPKIMLGLLPGHRQRQESYWKKQAHQDALFARLDLCNELRNRMAHHEPVWKLGELMNEARPRPGKPLAAVAPAPTNPGEAITRLTLLYARVTELLSWLSPPAAAIFSGSQIDMNCRQLMTEKALSHYQARRHPATIDLAKIAGSRKAKKLLKYAARHRQPLRLDDGTRVIGYLICPAS